MATTVAQHTVATFTSPVNGTTPIDANTVRGNDNTIRSSYNDHDSDPGIHVQSSTLASRPAAGTAGRKWITADAGEYKLWYDDGTRWNEVGNDAVDVSFIADGNIVKGDVLKLTGWNNGQNLPTLGPATVSGDVCFAIATETVTNGDRSFAINTGFLEDVNTSAFSTGDILYPSNAAGPGSITSWFQNTKPTSGNYQMAAYVIRDNASNGVLFVEFTGPRIVERSDNTASTVVLRDASGNFSAGTVTVGALTSTGLVTFASLKGTGATTVTNILDEDNMASDSATALATQQSIKAYVDSQVGTVDTLAEILANGNTSGGTNLIMSAGDTLTVDTIAETTAGAGVTIDSVLLKDDVVNATDVETGTVSANDGTLAITVANSTGALTLASALADSNLATISSAGKVANSATTADSANTASAIVARDGSGNFSAGTITAALTGNADTATKLSSSRTFALTGDVTGSVSSDLTSGASIATTISELPVSKLQDGSARQLLQTDAAGTGVEWTSNVDVPGTLDVTGATTLDSTLTVTGDANFDSGTLFVDESTSRVGVGTTSPTSKLHLFDSAASLGLQIESTATSGEPSLTLLGKNSSGTVRSFSLKYDNSDIIRLGTASPIDMRFETDDQERMRIDSSGNVGIGTTSPAETLDVTGTGRFNGASGTYVQFSYGGTGRGLIGTANAIVSGGAITDLALEATANLVLGTNGTERMRIDSSGNVGIGTTSPVRRLDVTGPITGYANLALTDTASGTTGTGGGIVFRSDNGSGTYVSVASIQGIKENATAGNQDGSLIFATKGSLVEAERMRIDSSGNVGIGVTPTASLHVERASTDNIIAAIGQTGYEGVLYLSGAGSGKDTSIVIGNGRGLNFKTTATATPTASGSTVMVLTPSYLRMASGSGGIQFNGDTAAANALDDYEEGTWTPVIEGSTSAGTGTYTAQLGRYTKVGRAVIIDCYIVWTAHTGTGDMQIAGLPFTNNATLNAAVSFGLVGNVTLTANNILTGLTNASATTIGLFQYPVGGGARSVVTMDSNAELMFSVTYNV